MLYSPLDNNDNDDDKTKNRNNKFEPQKIILSISSQDSQILYKEFIDAIRSPETKSRYNYGLSKFLDFMELDRNNLDSLIKRDPKLIQKDLTNYIMYLRNKGLSYSTMSIMLAPLFFFFSLNDITLNRKRINRYLGEHIKAIKDRAYTRQEIHSIIEACDLKYKVAVSLMISSGCRIGAIPKLRIGDIEYIEKYQIYQLTMYNRSSSEYLTFCTPEAAKYITEYLNYRERCGERLKPESPLIRDDFIVDDLLHVENPRSLTIHSYIIYLRNILIKCGLRTITPLTEENGFSTKNTRKVVSQNHGFRKFTHTIMANKRINPEIREMLLGHKIGLSSSYYRPTGSELLEEYLKVVDDLTINDENRLSKQVQELQEKNQDKDYIIQGKLSEKDDQIKALQESIKFLSDTVNRALLADPSNKIIYHDKDNVGTVKGIELKPEINHKAAGQVISSNSNKKKISKF